MLSTSAFATELNEIIMKSNIEERYCGSAGRHNSAYTFPYIIAIIVTPLPAINKLLNTISS